MAVVFAILAFSLIAASAASLGGIDTSQVGADATFVGSCDTDGVDAVFGDPSIGASGRYVVTEVTVSDIDEACIGQTLQVDVTDAGLVSLGGGLVYPIAGDSHTVTFSGEADAEGVTRIVVSIHSDDVVVP
jgi:hypothetical protein